MNIDKDKIIDKIKKLLKLGRNSNVKGEAENAIAAAMRLAAGIGLSVEDINPDDKEDNGRPEFLETDIGRKTRFESWDIVLAIGIADALGCSLLTTKRYRFHSFSLIGTKQDVVLFNWLFPYVRKQLLKLFREEFPRSHTFMPGKYRRSWFIGAAERVGERALEFFKCSATIEEQQQYALVVAEKKQLARAVEESMGIKNSLVRTDDLADSAFLGGYRAGEKVVLARPVESSEPKLQLCGE